MLHLTYYNFSLDVFKKNNNPGAHGNILSYDRSQLSHRPKILNFNFPICKYKFVALLLWYFHTLEV